MSVGCFLSIKASYIPEARGEADSLVEKINAVLRQRGLPAYADPDTPPDVYVNHRFGRSALDHHSGSCIAGLAASVADHMTARHMSLLLSSPPPVIYLPLDLPDPLVISRGGWLRSKSPRAVGCSPVLLRELRQVAPLIGIPLEDGSLTDSTAERINEFAPLFEGDTCKFAEDERTAWLLLYEGARLSCEHGVALCLH